MTPATLNPRLQEIVEDFNAMPDSQRLQLLLEFADELPPLPDRYAEDRSLLEPVPECQSPLFLAVEVEPDATVHLFFEAPREAPTTRGFASILHAGLDGLPADEGFLAALKNGKHLNVRKKTEKCTDGQSVSSNI